MNGDIQFKKEFMEKHHEYLSDYKTLFSEAQTGIDKWEEKWGMDFYNFPFEKVLEMLEGFKSSSVGALAKRLTLLGTYNAYAFNRKESISLKLPKPNTLDIKRSDLKTLVDSDKECAKYMTKPELYNKLPSLKNNIDKLLFILYFKGIWGKENSEIINLRKDDFNTTNNELNVNGKLYQLNENEADIMKKAINEEEYESYVSNSTKSYKVIDSEYIFRNLEGTSLSKDNIDLNKVDNTLLIRRIQGTTKFINENLWSAKTIYRSGIASRILKYYNYKRLWNKDIVKYKSHRGLSFNPVDMMNVVDIIRDKLKDQNIIEDSESEEDFSFQDEHDDFEVKIGELEILEKAIEKIFFEGEDFDDEPGFDDLEGKDDKFKPDDWVKEKEILGSKGEKIVYDMLVECYGKDYVINVRDKYCYDIALKEPNLKIEVKTTHIKKPGFIITKNELIKFSRNKEKYVVVLVILNNNDDEVVKISTIDNNILENCIKILDVTSENLYPNYDIVPNSIEVKLEKGYVEGLSYWELVKDLIKK